MRDYLRKCATPQRQIRKARLDTRLYHDFGIFGDIAEIYMEVLTEDYGVNLDDFDFDRYFPQETPQGGAMLQLFYLVIPFASDIVRSRERYAPLTLETIERAIQLKKLR